MRLKFKDKDIFKDTVHALIVLTFRTLITDYSHTNISLSLYVDTITEMYNKNINILLDKFIKLIMHNSFSFIVFFV